MAQLVNDKDLSNNMVRKIIVVTGKNDRFGSQYSAQISGFAMARRYNNIYRFSPFFGDKHSDIATEFCGMKSDKDDILTREPDMKYQRHCNPAQDREINEFFPESVIQEIRAMYYTTWKPDPVPCDVAMHIRRGDVGHIEYRIKNPDGTPYRHWLQRYDSNEYYKDCIEFLRKEYNNPELKIVIFSQGKKEEFEDLCDNEHVSLCLDGDWRIAYHSLVKAPILITSISEFAWTAGLLSEGIVYRNERMFRWPLKKWLKLPFL
jgi:hypothetical protein